MGLRMSLLRIDQVSLTSSQNQLKDTSDVHYFELPYIGNLSQYIKNKLLKLFKDFCKKNFNIRLVFNSFKIENYFSYKDSILYINLLVLHVVLPILAKLVVILKLGFRNI